MKPNKIKKETTKETKESLKIKEHQCGNELTEKEMFYDTCLKCGESIDYYYYYYKNKKIKKNL